MGTLFKVPPLATEVPVPILTEVVEGVFYTPNTEEIEVGPANGKNYKLDELYRLLDCTMIEVVSLRDGRILVCDEEGKLKPHFLNPIPTTLYRELGGDYIAGSALLCRSEELM